MEKLINFILDNCNNRKEQRFKQFFPNEYAEILTWNFPDDFKLVVSDLQLYKQFGNSVPTKMIEAVANNIIDALKEGKEID